MRTIGRFGLGKGVGMAIGLLCLALSVPGKVDAGPTYYAGNGHWYELVTGTSGWTAAKSAAESSTYLDMPGYLATITSQAESDFVFGTVAPEAQGLWLGGYQDITAPDYSEPAGGWRWVTGETWAYTNWADDPGVEQPDDGAGLEHYLETYKSDYPQWNDNQEPQPKGHIIEYGITVIPAPGALVLGLVGVGLAWAGSRFRRKG